MAWIRRVSVKGDALSLECFSCRCTSLIFVQLGELQARPIMRLSLSWQAFALVSA